MLTTQIKIHNSFKVPRCIFIEPWANDYTLLPGEALEITAIGKTTAPAFEIVEWEDSVQVYCNYTSDFVVTANGLQLECGYQRQPDGPAT
jgi:hypothetical protein